MAEQTPEWFPGHELLHLIQTLLENHDTWLGNSSLKYLDLRIDTRDGSFLLKDRHGNFIRPNDIHAAVLTRGIILKNRSPIKEFSPDYAVPPGETLLEVLEISKISLEELSESLELAMSEIESLISGTLPITSEIAEKLESAVPVPASLWMALEAHYRAALTRLGKEDDSDDKTV